MLSANASGKPPIIVRAMLGLGDNIHIRAAVREWAKTHEVHLETPCALPFHDFVADGSVKVHVRATRLHAQARQLERERHLFADGSSPPNATRRNIGYNKPDIDRCGSILHAIVNMAGLPPIEKPDFSLPVPQEWRDRARKLIAEWRLQTAPGLPAHHVAQGMG